MTHPYEHPKERAKAPPSASSSTATLVANSSFSQSTITLVGGSDFSASKSMLVAEEKGKTPLSAFRSTSTLVEDETKKIFSCAFVAEDKEKGPPSASWSTATADKRFSASTSTLVEDETKKVFSSAFVAEQKEKDPPSASAPASTSDTGPQRSAPAAAGAIGKAKGRSDIHGCYDVYKTVLDGLSNNSPANKQEGLLVLPPSAVTVFERLDKSASWTVLDGPDSIAEKDVPRMLEASYPETADSRFRAQASIDHRVWGREGLGGVGTGDVRVADARQTSRPSGKRSSGGSCTD